MIGNTRLIGSVTMLAILLSAGAGQVSAGPLFGWGHDDYGQCDIPDGNDFMAVAAGDYPSQIQLVQKCVSLIGNKQEEFVRNL